MADDESPDEKPSDPQSARRRRPPPVIDLKASEVPSDTPAAPPVEAATASPDLPPGAAAPTPSDPPPPGPEQESEPSPEPPPERRPPFAFVPEELSWSHAGAAIAGVAGGLLVALLFWLGGAFSGSHDADLSPRLASIEKQLNDLATRPTAAGADSQETKKTLDDIAARLAKLEAAAATPRPPVTDPVVLGRLTASENAAKSQADNVASLSRRADAADAAIRDAYASIAKLSASLDDVRNTARQAAAGSDRASRLAVAVSALRGAAERGDPFTAELAIVKPLASDANAIAQLEPFAASGVPSNATLGQELAALLRPMLRASDETVAAGSGFLDRLQANAEKLVRVRPVGEEAQGGDRTAILSRVEQRASQGNVAGARTELDTLPADARAHLQAWIAKADARDKAIAASRKLSADAVAALKATP
jgi:hypothetical protein